MIERENLALRTSERWQPPAFRPPRTRWDRFLAAGRRTLDLQAASVWRDLKLELATAHGRSRFAIEARLAKLGKIEPPANLRGNGARPHTAASDIAAYSIQH